MKKLDVSGKTVVAERASLRRRIRSLYRAYNRADWVRCYAHLDPKLRGKDKVSINDYTESLREFKVRYGVISTWYIRVSLHLDASRNKHDDRPFAYVYILWQDAHNGLHLFRERWVQDSGKWYTRVVGLVAHTQS
jgi:hypothetical protein